MNLSQLSPTQLIIAALFAIVGVIAIIIGLRDKR